MSEEADEVSQEVKTTQDIIKVLSPALGEETAKTLVTIVSTGIEVVKWIQENSELISKVVSTLSTLCKAVKAAYTEFKSTDNLDATTKEKLSKSAAAFSLEFKAVQTVKGLDAEGIKEKAEISDTQAIEYMQPIDKRIAELAAAKYFSSLSLQKKVGLDTENKPFLNDEKVRMSR